MLAHSIVSPVSWGEFHVLALRQIEMRGRDTSNQAVARRERVGGSNARDDSDYLTMELVAALSMSRWTSGAFPDGTYITIAMWSAGTTQNWRVPTPFQPKLPAGKANPEAAWSVTTSML